MQVTCSSCQNVLNIPDEKIPASGRFNVKCPHCANKILVEGAPATQRREAPAKKVSAPPKPELNLPAVEPDIIPPGTEAAFVFVQDGGWKSAAKAWLEQKGYFVGGADDELEAIAKLRLNSYAVLILEDFDGSRRLRDEVAMWPGHKRRETNLILLGTEAKSLDQNLAFRNGANFYMNTSDGENAPELLESAIQGYELYYELFNKATQGVGS